MVNGKTKGNREDYSNEFTPTKKDNTSIHRVVIMKYPSIPPDKAHEIKDINEFLKKPISLSLSSTERRKLR